MSLRDQKKKTEVIFLLFRTFSGYFSQKFWPTLRFNYEKHVWIMIEQTGHIIMREHTNYNQSYFGPRRRANPVTSNSTLGSAMDQWHDALHTHALYLWKNVQIPLKFYTWVCVFVCVWERFKVDLRKFYRWACVWRTSRLVHRTVAPWFLIFGNHSHISSID